MCEWYLWAAGGDCCVAAGRHFPHTHGHSTGGAYTVVVVAHATHDRQQLNIPAPSYNQLSLSLAHSPGRHVCYVTKSSLPKPPGPLASTLTPIDKVLVVRRRHRMRLPHLVSCVRTSAPITINEELSLYNNTHDDDVCSTISVDTPTHS